jgi:hypothetical protein
MPRVRPCGMTYNESVAGTFKNLQERVAYFPAIILFMSVSLIQSLCLEGQVVTVFPDHQLMYFENKLSNS